MHNSAIFYFMVATIITVIFDAIVALKSYIKNNQMGRSLAQTVVFAALVCLTYSFSVYSDTHFNFSLWSSIYFSCISWMLVNLLRFTIIYTRRNSAHLDKLRKYSYIFAAVETIAFATNPFHEKIIGYIPSGNYLVCYIYDKHPLYTVHLVFTYGLVVLIMSLLIQKAISIPKQYRTKYLYLCYAILFVVLTNAAFLFASSNLVISVFDCSIFTYSVVIILIYWFAFAYSTKNMLESLSMTVFSSLDQAILLFDYDGILALKNSKAESFFSPEIDLENELSLKYFMARSGIKISDDALEENCSIQCSIRKANASFPTRCDYTCIKDYKGLPTGYLLVFTDLELETDLLTGFHNWEYFSRYAAKNSNAFEYPMGVATFDINNLGLINSTLGRDSGDLQLANLADAMRNNFNSETYFMRREAVLFALCYNTDRNKLYDNTHHVVEAFEGSVQYAVAFTSENQPQIINAIEEAYKALRTKKLLDRDSNRSQALTSLMRALQETDEDTESHVQRTQQIGKELGKRIGLTDSDISDLSLLCLLHDIGKIGIPLEILNKPGKLTDNEWLVLKTHVEKGFQIAMSSHDFSHIADEILHHHERWDGKGYPSGLSRESIPLLSRIISVIDAFDAMINDRPYRKGMPVANAIAELKREAGHQFDPHIAAQFIKLIQDNPELANKEIGTGIIEESKKIELNRIDSPDTPAANLQSSHAVVYSKYTVDSKNYIIDCDDNFEKITGYTIKDVEDLHLSQIDLLPEEDRSEYALIVNELIAKYDTAYLEHRILCKNGDIAYVLCYGRVYYDSATKEEHSEIAICRITDTYAVRTIAQVEDNKSRHRLAQWENTFRRDSLTDLLNRQAFQNDIEQELLSGNYKILLLMIDVDNFKEYNDNFGHKAGDDYLIFLSNTLKTALRNEDMACRMGGDEFACAVLFKPEISNDQIYHRAHQIFDRISMSLRLMDKTTSLSMGAVISGEKQTFAELYQLADKKLYESKNKGRGRLSVGE